MVGHIHVTIDSLAVSRIFAQSNRIRPIAVTSARRCPLMPNIPTMAEAGVSGYEAVSWLTLAAPAKTPPGVIGKLNESVARFIIGSPDGIQRLQRLGAEPAGGSPEDMRRYVLAETEKWSKVVKFAGIEHE
jgi:tripartite-type tricarboxylate transporter receptor subunit TctC